MSVAQKILVALGSAFLVWQFVVIWSGVSMIRSGRYGKVSIPVLQGFIALILLVVAWLL